MGLLDQAWDAAGRGVTALARLPDLAKSLAKEDQFAPPVEQPKAMFFDPFALIDQMGYKERPSAITYYTLESMAMRDSVIAAIVQTRVNQLAAFAHKQRTPYDMGFRIKLRGAKRKPTATEEHEIERLENLVLHTGVVEEAGERDDFETFLRKIARDSLILDQATFEVLRNRRGKPAAFIAVDASTIRLAEDYAVQPDPRGNRDRVAYVQIYDGTVIAEFAREDLVFGVRNPRTSVRQNGYGFSELEMLITTITAHLWAEQYNSKFFSQGSSIKGVLNVKGFVPDEQLKAFRRAWYSMISGVANAWRTPILNSEDIQWISMHQNNRDMEFSNWIDYLIKVGCAVFQISPDEVGFELRGSGAGGGTSPMFESNNEARLRASRDKGLRPLIRSFFTWVNRGVIWPINPDFEIVAAGIDSKSEEQRMELAVKAAHNYMTVDEIRADHDLPPLPEEKGNVVLDPTWLQFAQSKDAPPPGAEGEDGGPPMPGPGDLDVPEDDDVPPPDLDAPDGEEVGGAADVPDDDAGEPLDGKSEDAPRRGGRPRRFVIEV